jgi:hypothetical protein
MGAGCRIVAYDNSNIPAICGGLGALVPSGDIEALSSVLATQATELRSLAWCGNGGDCASGYWVYTSQTLRHLERFDPPLVARQFLDALTHSPRASADGFD